MFYSEYIMSLERRCVGSEEADQGMVQGEKGSLNRREMGASEETGFRSWFDKLTTSGPGAPFVLSLSKDERG